MRRICVVTGSRAEYGLLYWLLRELKEASDVDLQLVVTGTHLAPEYGRTIEVIEADGFNVARRVEMLLSSDTADGTARSIGLGVIGMSDALVALQPDIVVLLGDRFEVLAAAQACLVHTIPLAHLFGGDSTEGAYDEAIRHAITKMAHLHFVTNREAAARVRQMGEAPEHIFLVGSTGIDYIYRTQLMSRTELEESLGATLGAYNVVVTFHPTTLEPGESLQQAEEMLAALDTLSNARFWITQPNADTGSRELTVRLRAWASKRGDDANFFTSLGQRRYLSLLRQADLVIGNSSSGLYEAPSFHVPTVDIGDRQKGRERAISVLHAEPKRDAIIDAIRQARVLDCSAVVNPYGDGRSAERIAAILREIPLRGLLKKSFHRTEVA